MEQRPAAREIGQDDIVTGKLVAGDDIVLTDLSSQQITKGAAPYDGSYSPQQPFVSTLLDTLMPDPAN